MRFMFVLLCLASPAFAQDDAVCPAVPDHAIRKAELLRDLRFARDETNARAISMRLWDIWTDAPDERSQMLLDEGMEELRRNDFASSRALPSELIDYCPHFAEGWNQRAFAAYLTRDYAGALDDIEHALALEPRHIPALTGKAMTLMELGRDDEAQIVLRDAVDLNPWLWERALLTIPLGTEL